MLRTNVHSPLPCKTQTLSNKRLMKSYLVILQRSLARPQSLIKRALVAVENITKGDVEDEGGNKGALEVVGTKDNVLVMGDIA